MSPRELLLRPALAPVRGRTWVLLNVIRFLSMISILLVFVSTIVVMACDFKAVHAWIKAGSSASGLSDGSADADEWECDVIQGSTIPNQVGGVFYSIANRFVVLFVLIVLFLSEVSGPRHVRRFFELYLPPLGPAHGLAVLGFLECFVATIIMSHFVPLFSVVSCSFLFVLGLVNMFIGYFGPSIKTQRLIFSFEGPPPSLAPRPTTVVWDEEKAPSTKYKLFPGGDGRDDRKYVSFGGRAQAHEKSEHGVKPAGFGGFGQKGTKEAKLKGYLISKPQNVTPRP